LLTTRTHVHACTCTYIHTYTCMCKFIFCCCPACVYDRADVQRGTSFFGVGWCNAVERPLLGGGNFHEPDAGDMVNQHFLCPCMFEVPNHVASPSLSQVLTVVPHMSITALGEREAHSCRNNARSVRVHFSYSTREISSTWRKNASFPPFLHVELISLARCGMCTRACTHVYIHVHTCIYVHARVYTRTCMCLYTCTQSRMYPPRRTKPSLQHVQIEKI
jgi:hypothetical protein